MTVIELGDYTSGSEHTAAGAPREFDRRILRRLALAAVAVLTVLTVTGSARPEPRGVRTLWSLPFTPAEHFVATSDSVYVSTTDATEVLTTYDIADGAVRWSIRMTEPTGWPIVGTAAGVVLLPTALAGEPDLGEFYRETIALDARTGIQLWRQRGDVYTHTDDLAVLADWGAHGQALQGFRAVRLRDGGVVWDRSGAAADRLAVGGPDRWRANVLVAVKRDGAAEVIRLADGVGLAAGRLDWPASAPERGEFNDLLVDDRRVYVRHAGGPGASLTAYALDTLHRMWSLADAARVAAYPCGAVLCGLEGDGYAAYDPDTGATRWRAAGVRNVWQVRPGRLLADEGAYDVYALLDEATGRRIAGLGFGTPIEDDRSGAVYLLRTTRSPATRMAVSRVDLDTGAVSLRGTIDRFGEHGCSVAGDRLVCPTLAGRLVVTEVA